MMNGAYNVKHNNCLHCGQSRITVKSVTIKLFNNSLENMATQISLNTKQHKSMKSTNSVDQLCKKKQNKTLRKYECFTGVPFQSSL